MKKGSGIFLKYILLFIVIFPLGYAKQSKEVRNSGPKKKLGHYKKRKYSLM